ncbi:MAG TPA: hypothetical protein VGH20_13010 [Myxococcales bacterium]
MTAPFAGAVTSERGRAMRAYFLPLLAATGLLSEPDITIGMMSTAPPQDTAIRVLFRTERFKFMALSLR